MIGYLKLAVLGLSAQVRLSILTGSVTSRILIALASLTIFSNNLDKADDIPVELIQLVSGNPVLRMLRSANHMHLPVFEIAHAHIESRHISHGGIIMLGVPVSGYLSCISLGEYRIEDWLFGKSRRKSAPTGGCDKIKFVLANWPVQGDAIWHIETNIIR